ncbi:MAG: Peptidyl-prolyl cis-trans isomerase PpiB [uncultured Pyrinomonadaceae bacterium]|uniref:Peptidyl-prolyl cis-trans isomerase n=1 Tax=uncultured Pyrinomonadaceae bacterium TaxID=2283094 RepID=A0A6J4P725_9BACT|nr:MAG: Peptidyl-prolyl cis-trans isomerase PpiB [uncultured Pyrinomonadaceae bacterium]
MDEENEGRFFIIENFGMRKKITILKTLYFIAVCLFASLPAAKAQEKPSDAKIKETAPKTVKKTNQRPAAAPKTPTEPFEKATAEAMAAQCVKFETEAGVIEMEMYPESAPESVRGFLNLAATGSLDTTTFSRVVPGFVIQGGDLFTREKMTPEIDKRARRVLPDEPSQIKHERGVVSMARGDEPNSASTHFFILLREARTLDGKFAAFGRVTRGMETVEAINKMPVEGEKPTKPVRITRAAVAPCAASIKP